jgi:hypothetical protein
MTVLTIDGPQIKCAFHTWSCSDHIAGSGGFDQHHRWPKSMGGPEHPPDLLILCPNHHRRQHALVRAMCERGTDAIHTLHWFSPAEKAVASYAFASWLSIGSPHISWVAPAALLVET